MGDRTTLVSSCLPARSGAHRQEGDSVLVVGKNIVQFDADRAPRELKGLLKEPEHLIYTLIVPVVGPRPGTW